MSVSTVVDQMNRLWFGDNLEVLRKEIGDESVDLIYLDPPFNSDRSYNILFSTIDGDSDQAQIRAFDDSWLWGIEAQETYDELAVAPRRRVSPKSCIKFGRRFVFSYSDNGREAVAE